MNGLCALMFALASAGLFLIAGWKPESIRVRTMGLPRLRNPAGPDSYSGLRTSGGQGDSSMGKSAGWASGGRARLRVKKTDAGDFIAELISLLHNGSGMVDACQEMGGMVFAIPELTDDRMKAVLARRCGHGRSDRSYLTRLARQLVASCNLSATLGCSASQCLEAVGVEHKRYLAVADKKRSALSIPRLTVKVLLILPLLVLGGSQLTSARTFQVLFMRPVGWLCLSLAAILYGLGLRWVKRLLRDFHRECGRSSGSGSGFSGHPGRRGVDTATNGGDTGMKARRAIGLSLESGEPGRFRGAAWE